MLRRTVGTTHTNTLEAAAHLAAVHVNQGRFAEAETELREALRAFEGSEAVDAWQRDYGQCVLGASLAGEGKLSEAGPLLLTGYTKLQQHMATIPAPSRFIVVNTRAWAEKTP